MLNKRYLLLKNYSSEGAHGVIYLAKDSNTGKEVLAKITNDQSMNFKEHSIL